MFRVYDADIGLNLLRYDNRTSSAAKRSLTVLFAGALGWVGSVTQVSAQTGGSALQAQPEAVAAPPPAPNAEFNRYEPFRVKGLTINIAPPSDTIDQEAFGLRAALADKGIGYLIYSNSNFTDNIWHHGHPLGNSRTNQVYAGQLPTGISATAALVTYDLSRYGIENGQIVLGAGFAATNWQPLGPRTISLASASYYQTFLNGKVELKVGYFPNTLEFLGTQVGGNLASGVFGFSATILGEQGLNTFFTETPGINVKVNLPGNFYDKIGVQRAVSPDGTVVEHRRNPSATSFTAPNAGAWFINEAGYRIAASPGSPQTWIRAAASYTNSNYLNYDMPGRRSGPSYGLFLLADRQLVQTAPVGESAARGIYAGLSVEYAPPQYNRFSQYYEGRIYGFGLIPSRPLDLVSLVYNRNVYSDLLVNASRAAGNLAHAATNTYSVSYSAHVFHGINLNVGLSYIDNPTPVSYNTHTGSALSTYLGAVTFF